MGFANVGAVVDAHLDGRSWYATWRKSPSQISSAGVWFDLSMSPGNPVPQYYAASPLAAKALAYSTDGGIWHGANVAPSTKHLSRMTAFTVTATALPEPRWTAILADRWVALLPDRAYAGDLPRVEAPVGSLGRRWRGKVPW